MRFVLALMLLAAPLAAQVVSTMGGAVTGIPPKPAGGAPVCAAGLDETSIAGCWKFEEDSGDTLGDSVGANNCQLGSAAGADANDPDWETGVGLVFDGANSDRVVCPAFVDPSDAFTLTVVLKTGPDDEGGIPMFVTQLAGTGTALRYLAQGASDVLFNNFGTPPGANTHGGALADETWHALTIRHDGAGEVCLAVNDGTPQCTTETVPASDGSVLLGADNDLSGNWFTGRMAAMVLWSAEKSDTALANNCTGFEALLSGRGETLGACAP